MVGAPANFFTFDDYFTPATVKNLLKDNSGAEVLYVHITSNGGSVNDAFAIHDILTNSGKKIITVIEGMCASAATIISMAGSERQMTQYSQLMIHNPYGLVQGDADELQKAADEMQRIEDKIANFYADKTGTSAQKFDKWMKEEKYMDAEEALSLGFVTEVLQPAKAVALINSNNHQNQNSSLMEFLKEAKATLTEIKNSLFGAPKNLDLTDAAGKCIKVDTAGSEPAVGDPCSIDNQPASDGEHIIPAMNKVLVVGGGKITEIKDAKAADEPAADPAPADDSEAVNTLKKQLEAVNKKNSDLEAKLKDQESDIKTLHDGLTEIKGAIKSRYTPDGRAINFNRAAAKPEGEEIDKVADAKRKREEREAAAKK